MQVFLSWKVHPFAMYDFLYYNYARVSSHVQFSMHIYGIVRTGGIKNAGDIRNQKL